MINLHPKILNKVLGYLISQFAKQKTTSGSEWITLIEPKYELHNENIKKLILTYFTEEFQDELDFFDLGITTIDAFAACRLYLRESSDPVIPFSFYDTFILLEIPENGNALEHYSELIRLLPKKNQQLLKILLEFCEMVIEISTKDKEPIYPIALAKLFGPLVLRGKHSGYSIQSENNQIRVIKILIELGIKLFKFETTGSSSKGSTNPTNAVS